MKDFEIGSRYVSFVKISGISLHEGRLLFQTRSLEILNVFVDQAPDQVFQTLGQAFETLRKKSTAWFFEHLKSLTER